VRYAAEWLLPVSTLLLSSFYECEKVRLSDAVPPLANAEGHEITLFDPCANGLIADTQLLGNFLDGVHFLLHRFDSLLYEPL
jgi:hypothetical protein